MRVATWNINGLRARLEFLTHWLHERRPDVVGLQEIKLTDEQFPHAELEAEGYQALCHGEKGRNGVAILTRQPARCTQKGLPGQEEFGARLLTADVDDLSFTTVYTPNGKYVGHADFPRKLAWLDTLAEHFEVHHLPDKPVILCGDMNVCPAPIDSWNETELKGSIFHTDEERSRLQRLFSWGLRDVFREKHPDDQSFSWWDYRAGGFHQNRGLRIDLLLTTPTVLTRVRSASIDRDYRKKKAGLTPSDHAPVLADLDSGEG